jgi:hypothetical protein
MESVEAIESSDLHRLSCPPLDSTAVAGDAEGSILLQSHQYGQHFLRAAGLCVWSEFCFGDSGGVPAVEAGTWCIV